MSFFSHNDKFILGLYFYILVRVYTRKLKINFDENGVELQQRESDFLNDERDSTLQNLLSSCHLHAAAVDEVWWCIDELLVRYQCFSKRHEMKNF